MNDFCLYVLLVKARTMYALMLKDGWVLIYILVLHLDMGIQDYLLDDNVYVVLQKS